MLPIVASSFYHKTAKIHKQIQLKLKNVGLRKKFVKQLTIAYVGLYKDMQVCMYRVGQKTVPLSQFSYSNVKLKVNSWCILKLQSFLKNLHDI